MQNFMNSPWQVICSPWRVELSSLVGICHVSFEGLGRLNSPRK